MTSNESPYLYVGWPLWTDGSPRMALMTPRIASVDGWIASDGPYDPSDRLGRPLRTSEDL